MDQPADKYTVHLRALAMLPQDQLMEANKLDSRYRVHLWELFKAINQVKIAESDLEIKEDEKKTAIAKRHQAGIDRRFLPIKIVARGGEALIVLARDRQLDEKAGREADENGEFESQNPDRCVIFRIALPGIPQKDKPGERFPRLEEQEPIVSPGVVVPPGPKKSVIITGQHKLLSFCYNPEKKQREELERQRQLSEEQFQTEKTARAERSYKIQDRLHRMAAHKGLFRHAYIPRVYSVSTGPRLYGVMEYIRGKALLEWCPGKSDLQKLELFRALVTFLFELFHKSWYVHCDIKPKNVLVLNEQPVILDFGMAKNLYDSSEDVTGPGTVMLGTPMYSSEEQLSESYTRGFKDEFVPLGRTLWCMFAGREIDKTGICWREDGEIKVDFAEIRRRYDQNIFTDFSLRCFFEKMVNEKGSGYQDIEHILSDLGLVIESCRSKLTDTQSVKTDCKSCKYVKYLFSELQTVKKQVAVLTELATLFGNHFQENDNVE